MIGAPLQFLCLLLKERFTVPAGDPIEFIKRSETGQNARQSLAILRGFLTGVLPIPLCHLFVGTPVQIPKLSLEPPDLIPVRPSQDVESRIVYIARIILYVQSAAAAN